jgi:hypothetical protein
MALSSQAAPREVATGVMAPFTREALVGALETANG